MSKTAARRRTLEVILTVLAGALATPSSAQSIDINDILRGVVIVDQILGGSSPRNGDPRPNPGAGRQVPSPEPSRPSPARQSPQPDPEMQAIQAHLARLGYNPGAADGLWGGKSARALAAFQRDAGLPQGDKPNELDRAVLQAPETFQLLRAQRGGATFPLTVMPGYDVPGGDYRNPNSDPRLQGISLDQCITTCAQDVACGAFTYNASENWCFLKQGVAETALFAGAVSGIKSGPANASPLTAMVAPSVPSQPDTGWSADSAAQQRDQPSPPAGVVPLSPFGGPPSPTNPTSAQLPRLGGPALPAFGTQSTNVTGIWRAVYTCGVEAQVEIVIDNTDIKDTNGRIIFQILDKIGQQYAGEILLNARFDPVTRKLKVGGREWVREPAVPDYTYLPEGFEGIVDLQRGTYVTSLKNDYCGQATQVTFHRITDDVLAQERAAAEARLESFKSSPIAGVWQGWTMCAAGPMGVAFRPTPEERGITARVRVFPLIQYPTGESAEFGTRVSQSGDIFTLQADREKVDTDTFGTGRDFKPFSMQLRWDPAQNAFIGALDAQGCQGVALTRSDDLAFERLFVTYRATDQFPTAAEMTQEQQFFNAKSLNSACRAATAWQNSLFEHYKNVKRFDAIQRIEQKRKEIPYAIMLPELFAPFFGRDAESMSSDEGTAVASVILACLEKDYPLDLGRQLVAYIPNTYAKDETIRTRIAAAMETVRPAYQWRTEALAQLDDFSQQVSDEATIQHLQKEMELHRKYLLPLHAKELDDQLAAANTTIAQARELEKTRQRKAYLDGLVSDIVTGETSLTTAQLLSLTKAIEANEIILTSEQATAFDTALTAALQPDRARLAEAIANPSDAAGFEATVESIQTNLRPFLEFEPARELSNQIAAARKDFIAARLNDLGPALAAAQTREEFISVSGRLWEVEQGTDNIPQVRVQRRQLDEEIETWASDVLAKEAAESKTGAVPAASPQQSAPAQSMLGDFEILAGNEPASSGEVYDGIFRSGKLKQQDLLRAFYEGDKDTLYQQPRALAIFYIWKLTDYYEQACPAVLPDGLVLQVFSHRNALGSGWSQLVNAYKINSVDNAISEVQLTQSSEADAGLLGETFGCPGEQLKTMFKNMASYYERPAKGVSAEVLSLRDACLMSPLPSRSTSSPTSYCDCSVPMLEERLSPKMLTYAKSKPDSRFDDVMAFFPSVAAADQSCLR